MKRYLGWLPITLAALAVFRALVSGAETNVWGAATNKFQISICTKGGEKHFKSNEAVTLLIRLRNLSATETFVFYRANAAERSPDFSYTVIAPSGKDVSPPRPFGYHGSGTTVDIRPRDSEEMQVNVSKLCTLGEIGTYKIIVRHWPSRWPVRGDKPLELFEAVSNPLYVCIGPGQKGVAQ